MWDVLVRTPRGSNNPRKFSMLLATFFVALLGYIFASAPSAYAAEASWEGDNIVYDGATYAPVQSNSAFPDDIKESPAIYRYVDEGQNPDLVYFIYFADDVRIAKSEKEATYVRYTLNPPNNYINPTDKQTITLTPVEAGETADTDDGALTSTCTIDSIGWLVCPLMNGIAEGMDFIYERIRAFMEVQPITTSVDNPIFRIWSYSRDLANVAFVIGFMVIIYSYLVGGGFNGYEIRKILPRLVVAAILINISYVICAAAVDISNIAGYGVNQLFENVRDDVLPGSQVGSTNWTSVTAWVLAGGAGAAAGAVLLPAAIGGAAGGLWFMLAPFLLGAALLVMVTFLILAARQAIIIILIAVAPLAFAAFILPNTEKWFERWRSLFFTMLIMFPAFGAVFGGAQLAGEVIIRTATTIEQIILGLGVMVAPLAITPLLLKLGGGVLNRFGGIVNNPRKGLYDRYKNYNRDRLGEHVAKNNAANAAILANGGFRRRQFMRRRAATDFAKKNYRDEQKKQDEESAVNSWHRQTGRWGYDNHQGRDSVQSRLTRRPQNGYGNLDTYKRDNQLFHGQTEAHHEEHWQQLLNADASRREMLTDTRLSEGRGKVLSGAMEAQDERLLRTNITKAVDPQYAALRDMQVQAKVDTNLADAMKGRLDTEGDLKFKQSFVGSSQEARDLRKSFNETVSMKKQTGEIDTILEKRADAHWERTSVQDDEIRKIRLEAVEASESATKYEQQWTKMVENIKAQGASAPNITNTADKTIAGNIKQLGQDITVEKWAIEAAQREAQQNMSAELKGNATLRAYAGGIGGVQAANRIYAKAKKDVVSAYMEDVSNSRSVLSDYTAKELVRLHVEGIDRDNVNQLNAGNTAIIDAAMQEIALNKGNNWAFQKMRDRVADMGMIYDEDTGHYFDLARDSSGQIIRDPVTEQAVRGARLTNQDEIDRRRDVQQLFADAAKQSKLRVANLSQTDLGNYESGLSHTTGKGAIIRDIITGKFDQEKVVSMDVDELQRMVQVLREPGVRDYINNEESEALGKLLAQIDGAQRNKQLNGKIKDRERGIMNAIAGYIDPAEATRTDVEEVYYVDPLNDYARVPKGTPGAVEQRAKVKAPSTYDRTEQN